MSGKERSGRGTQPRGPNGSADGFGLDTGSGVPFYRQIVQSVENNMGAGRLRPGDRLPTIRALSVALKVNPNTIAKAYTELELRGLVHTQVGSGTYVSAHKVDAPADRSRNRKRAEEACWELIRRARALGVARSDMIEMLESFWED
jgi:GntR family transcriptional regulator